MPIENIQKFVLVLLYGSLVLQSFTLLANPMNVNKKANFAFGIFLFLWSGYWILDILTICGFSPGPILIFSFPLFLRILVL